MKLISKILYCAIIAQLSLGTSYARVNNEQPQVTKPLITLLRAEAQAHPEDYFKNYELEEGSRILDKVEMLKANKALEEQLKDDSFNLEEIKRDIYQRLQEEEMAQLIEFKHILKNLPEHKIETYFDRSKDLGVYDDSLKVEFAVAYTLKEKKAVLIKMLHKDLTHLKSRSLKKLGKMDRNQLLKEVGQTEYFLNKKGDGWKVAALIALSVAVAGLATWGIIAATKKRHERKMRELEEDHQRRMDQADADFASAWESEIQNHEDILARMLEDHQNEMDWTQQEYENKMKELEDLFAERARLRDEGYLWDVCQVEQVQKVVTCPYNFQTYVGTEVCSTRCLKQPQTGHIYSSTSLICTSAEIPENCYSTNPYTSGYNNGADSGYDDGYIEGYNDHYGSAYNAAYDDYYSVGLSDGRSDGYNEGFNQGYADGIADGNYDSDATYSEGYDDGYSDGYNYASGL